MLGTPRIGIRIFPEQEGHLASSRGKLPWPNTLEAQVTQENHRWAWWTILLCQGKATTVPIRGRQPLTRYSHMNGGLYLDQEGSWIQEAITSNQQVDTGQRKAGCPINWRKIGMVTRMVEVPTRVPRKQPGSESGKNGQGQCRKMEVRNPGFTVEGIPLANPSQGCQNE